jgi:hypothetical protein
VELPVIPVPDGPNLLNAFYGCKINVRPYFVRTQNEIASMLRTQNEIASMFFEVLSFAEADVTVLSVKSETSLFECDCGSGMFVTLFSIPWRVIICIIAGVPAVERFSELLENSLTGLRVQILVAFVAFEIRREPVVPRDMPNSIPDALDVPAADVPEFGGGECERIEIRTHL